MRKHSLLVWILAGFRATQVVGVEEFVEGEECLRGEMVEREVNDTISAGGLAASLSCSIATQFKVDWHGNVSLESTLNVRNGSTLDITGWDDAAVDGAGIVRLFSVSGGATLQVNSATLTRGSVQGGGGAISANETSVVILQGSNLVDNEANDHGGGFGVKIYYGSTLK